MPLTKGKKRPSAVEYDPDIDLDVDENTLLGGENDIIEVLRMLGQQRGLRLTKDQKAALKNSKLKTFDKAFTQYNMSITEEDEEKGEHLIIHDFDETPILKKIWKSRPPWLNWTLCISFHLVTLFNFVFCLWESLARISENSIFDLMLLEDTFQCLEVVPNQRSLAHLVNIFHALTCVTVLHARCPNSANLCWAFLIGTTTHVCFKMYEIFFDQRFTFDKPVRNIYHHPHLQLLLILFFQILAIFLVIQRYYDLTENFQRRARLFSTQTYEGRQLNDKISYRNLSSFVQRKNVLRSCTALQIYSTVRSLQAHQRRLKRGEELDDDTFNREVRDAVDTLREVENIHGKEMLKELKRRQYKKTQQGDLFDDVNDQQQNNKYNLFKDEDGFIPEDEESAKNTNKGNKKRRGTKVSGGYSGRGSDHSFKIQQ